MRISQGFISSITMAGVSLPLSTALVLTARGNATYDSFRRNGAIYQVPVGKKLKIYAIRAISDSATAQAVGRIGQADAGASHTAGAPAGYADVSVGGVNSYLMTTGTTYSPVESQLNIEISALKYPVGNFTSAHTLVILAQEVDA